MFPNNMVLMSTNLARSVAHVKFLIYTHKDGGNVYKDVKNEGYIYEVREHVERCRIRM